MNHSPIAAARRLLVALLAGLLAVPPVWADDTEIYFSDTPAAASAPLVMFSLDLRSSLTAEFCKKGDACRLKFGGDAIGDHIYAQLDTLGITTDGASVSQVDALKAALMAIFLSDIPDGKKIGLMVSHDSGNNSCTTGSTNCSQGGYIMRGYELVGPDDPATTDIDDPNGARAELVQIIKDLPLNQGSAAHPYQGIGLFMEMYRYLSGQNVLHGKLGYTDYQSKNPKGTPSRNLDFEFNPHSPGPAACNFGTSGENRSCNDYVTGALGSYDAKRDSNLNAGEVRISSTLTWDPTIMSGNRYLKPGGQSCGTAYTINLLFGVSDDGGNGNPNGVAAARPVTSTPTGGLGLASNPNFAQVISALKNFNQAGGQTDVPNVTSYFLTPATGPTNGQVLPYAIAGGTGKPIPALDDPRKTFDALKGVFDQINSVSASYVAVTVPVNADNRVTSLPNLFVALFQVDENGRPYWPGNVKKLDIVESDPDPITGIKTLSIQDASGAAAFNPTTGRLNDNALTVWTDPDAADLQTENSDLTKGPILVKKRDGSAVRRGGAGHKIPGFRYPLRVGSGVGEANGDTDARQIFIDPATVTGSAAAGNPMVALDASSSSALLADTAIQDLLGVHATSLTATCPGRDADNYCVTFINQVLAAAGQSTTPAAATKASTATRLFLRWIRGYDVFNEAGVTTGPPWNGLTTTVQRKWMMGDVLHSRPVAINYGARPPGGTDYSEENQDVRLIFGANEGLLRMVRNTLPGDSKPDATAQQGDDYGEEVWAFMPRELLAHVPELAMNFGNAGLNRPYGADGPPTLFTIDTNRDGIIDNDGDCTVGQPDCDRAWIYFGLRRGGKSYYAVDVSNPDAPTPKLLWKVDSTMADFTELGMTFATPRVGWVRFEDVTNLNQYTSADVTSNVPVPVVIFGGGYNGHAVTGGDHHQSSTGGPSKDTILGTPFTDADPQGNAIYLVHARTGQLIWKATSTGLVSATQYTNAMMQHGIAAPVSPMDSDSNGILDRLYVADTGGRVWRVDLPEFVPGGTITRAANWKATVLADLRPADIATSTVNDLRFFHGATIVRRARDGIGVYDALYLGSGDREHPQSDTYDVTSGDFTTTVTKINWFFLLKDRLTTSGDSAVASRTPYVPGDLLDVTDACFTGATTSTCSAADLSKGWRLKLEELGEKNLSEPFIGGEGVIFTTYLPRGTTPDDKACVPLGQSRLYQVSLDTGAPRPFLRSVTGDTFSKLDRWINLYAGLDGGVVAVSPDFWITATGKSGSNPPQKPIQFYWRESGIDTVK